MSEGSIFQRKDGRWVGKFKDVNGSWKCVYRKTKPEAKKALREALTARDNGLVRVKNGVSIGALVEDWIEDNKDDVSERTNISRRSLLNANIRNHTIASKKPRSLTETDLKRFYAAKTTSTARRLHILLKAALGNQMPAVKQPRITEEREIKVLTPEQVNILLSHVRDTKYELVFVFGATAGLRIGEILALRWRDMDTDKGTLTVRHTLFKGKLLPPKTKSSHRTIKLPARAIEAVQRHYNASEGFIFATRNGNPQDAANFHNWIWKPTLRDCGLPDIHFHDLRHGVASMLLANRSVPITTVAKYLGHTPDTLLKVYAHCIDGMEDWV